MSEPYITAVVNVAVETTVRSGTSGSCPIHEIPLMEKRLAMNGGETLRIVLDWPTNIRRVVPLTREQVNAEVERLLTKYTFQVGEGDVTNLVDQIYGTPAEAGVMKALKRIYEGLQKLDLDELTVDQLWGLVRLANPVNEDTISGLDAISETDLKQHVPEPAAELDGALIDALKAAGISARVAVETARLKAAGSEITLETLTSIERVGPDTAEKVLGALELVEAAD